MILTATALTRDGSIFLVSSMVDRGGGDEVPASRSSSLSFELSRSLRFCLLKTNQINSISSDRTKSSQQCSKMLTTKSNRCWCNSILALQLDRFPHSVGCPILLAMNSSSAHSLRPRFHRQSLQLALCHSTARYRCDRHRYCCARLCCANYLHCCYSYAKQRPSNHLNSATILIRNFLSAKKEKKIYSLLLFGGFFLINLSPYPFWYWIRFNDVQCFLVICTVDKTFRAAILSGFCDAAVLRVLEQNRR